MASSTDPHSVNSHSIPPSGREDDFPNPFSLARQVEGPSARERLIRSIQTLVITLALTAILLTGVVMGKQFLLNRLVASFDSLDLTQKQARLVQISGFGTDAIGPLTDRLLDREDEVSETAFGLLRQLQNDWITMRPAEGLAAHGALVAAITQRYSAQEVTAKQLARGRELLRKTVTEFSSTGQTAGRSKSEISSLLASASEGLNRLSKLTIVDRIGRPGEDRLGGRIGAGSMATGATQSEAGWTDWPPPTSPQIVRSGAKPLAVSSSLNPEGMNSDADASGNGIDPPNDAIAGRTPRRLGSVPGGVTVRLENAPGANLETVVAARRAVSTTVEMTTHLSDSPMTALDNETVIRHLANPDVMLAKQAERELAERGFSPSQLEMATSIAVAGPLDRIRLIDTLVHGNQWRSGPWLSMLLDDPDRRVRLHVASTLATTLATNRDPELLKRLRQRLDQEQDIQVATRLRKILELR